jgi:hypothetical protein
VKAGEALAASGDMDRAAAAFRWAADGAQHPPPARALFALGELHA